MSGSVGAPQQYKQSSRKGKKAWRKHVDISDVQSGLDSLREEIRQGGPIAEKASEDLFALDAVGSQDIKKRYQLHRPLKVDEILARRSAIPAVDSRKRTGPKISDGILEPVYKRQKKDWVSKKEVLRLKQVAGATSHLTEFQLNHDEAYTMDLWADASEASKTTGHELEYVPKAKAKVAPSTLRHRPTAMTADGKAVRSIPTPGAGTSYNPTFEDWDDLLHQEGAKELEAEQHRQRVKQEEDERQARIAAAAESDAELEHESAWEGFESEAEEEMLKKKRPQRKTPAERNKIKRRKELEQQAKHERRMGEKHQRAEQILSGLILKEGRNDAALAARTNSADDGNELLEEDNERKLRRRKLGNIAIPPQNLELLLPDELQESLRQLKPEGNLLQDRFRNLLVNGKIESRKAIVQPRKKKTKVSEKWSYKDFRIPV